MADVVASTQRRDSLLSHMLITTRANSVVTGLNYITSLLSSFCKPHSSARRVASSLLSAVTNKGWRGDANGSQVLPLRAERPDADLVGLNVL